MSVSEDDHTAFANAIESGDALAARSLLEQFPELVNHPQWTPPPLHCAVLWNQLEVAELLLDHGADIEMLDPDRQTTPLRYAIMYCKTDLIPMLLTRGAHSGATVDGGASALELAEDGAAGKYEEYEDLPRKEAYRKVVNLLLDLGLGGELR